MVPNLVGQEITQELYDQLIDEPDYWTLALVEAATRDFEPGRAFNQVPGAGQIVPGGSTITLEIAVEPELLPVRSHRAERVEAKQQLAAAGYEVVVDVAADPDGGDTPTPGLSGLRTGSGTLDDTVIT